MNIRLFFLIQVLAYWPLSARAAAGPFLECQAGEEVEGPNNDWSKTSTCPAGFLATGIAKLDLLGDHKTPNLHANDLRCEDSGCKAWCYGSGCRIRSRCCRVVVKP